MSNICLPQPEVPGRQGRQSRSALRIVEARPRRDERRHRSWSGLVLGLTAVGLLVVLALPIRAIGGSVWPSGPIAVQIR